MHQQKNDHMDKIPSSARSMRNSIESWIYFDKMQDNDEYDC